MNFQIQQKRRFLQENNTQDQILLTNIDSTLNEIGNNFNKGSLPNSDIIQIQGEQINMSVQVQTPKYTKQLFQQDEQQFIQFQNEENQLILMDKDNISYNLSDDNNQNNDIFSVQYKDFKDSQIMSQIEGFPYKNQRNGGVQEYLIQTKDQEGQIQSLNSNKPLPLTFQQQYDPEIKYQTQDDIDKIADQNVCIQNDEKQSKELFKGKQCQSTKQMNSNGSYSIKCQCEQINKTTIIHDINQLFQNSKVEEVFSNEGLRDFVNFKFYQSYIFYGFLIITIIFIILMVYGHKEDKAQLKRIHNNINKFTRGLTLLSQQNKNNQNIDVNNSNRKQSILLQRINTVISDIQKEQDNNQQQNKISQNDTENPIEQYIKSQGSPELLIQKQQSQILQEDNINLDILNNNNNDSIQEFPQNFQFEKSNQLQNQNIDNQIQNNNSNNKNLNDYKNNNDIDNDNNNSNQIVNIKNKRRNSRARSKIARKKTQNMNESNQTAITQSSQNQQIINDINQDESVKKQFSDIFKRDKVKEITYQVSEKKQDKDQEEAQKQKIDRKFSFLSSRRESKDLLEKKEIEVIPEVNENYQEKKLDQKNQKSSVTDINKLCKPKVKPTSHIWHFHEFFNIMIVRDKKLSRPLRYAIYYLKVVLPMAAQSLFDNEWSLAQKIILGSVVVLISSIPIALIENIIRVKFLCIKIFGICLHLLIVIFCYYVTITSAAVIGLEESNQWGVIYFQTVFLDIFGTQLCIGLIKIIVFNSFKQTSKIFKMFVNENIATAIIQKDK